MELALAQPALVRPSPAHRSLRRIRPPDGDLIGRIGGGDRGAFDELYRRYARPCSGSRCAGSATAAARRRPCRRRSPRSGARRRATGPIGAPGGPGSTPSRATRSSTASASRGEPAPRRPTRAAEARGPDERAEADWVAGASTGRSRSCRSTSATVVELAYWSGLSQSEVATFLDIPLGTVKTRTRSALSRLADLLEGEDLR